jgi:hypothetical protein
MKNQILALGCLLLVGCGGLEGQLKVSQTFSLFDRKGQETVFSPGSQEVNLVYKESKNRLTLTLNETQEKIEIQTPEGFTVPDNGPFNLKAQDSGQMVDIKGEVKTTQKQSQPMREQQSCNYTAYEPVCYTGPNGQTSCSTQAVNKLGWQTVEYYNIETRQVLNSDFIENGIKVAAFFADNTWRERRETYKGQCW